LTLAVGVALARALDDLGARKVQLKWPNDLLLNDKKLCGVLVETTGNDEACAVVIGIGINVRLPTELTARIDQPATDLAVAGVHQSRNEILARILIRMREVLRKFERQGFAAFRAEWDHRHAYRDRMADVVLSASSTISGKILGVNNDGALLIETTHGAQALYSGDVRVRALAEGAR
jgi:BirA family biotin operon repressor/biotin-[acetyl-CoA-carboxylase] ligase